MKVAIYSPYLDTLGGGEKYMMTIAETFSVNHSVDVLLDNHLEKIDSSYLKDQLSNRFNLNLQSVNFVSAPFGKGKFISRAIFLKQYDLLFYLTDGSIFYSTAKKNILHIQSPLIGQPAINIWGKLKLKRWDLIIYNSNFTKENAAKNWPLKSEVIYPPVDIKNIKHLKKKKYILSVGRFFGYLKDKKHKELIAAFKDLCEDPAAKDWSLHLVGSAGEGDQEYLSELKQAAGKLSINFYPNLDFDKLMDLYGESSIYWHAAGFEETDPTKMEHFGISTVEAMSGGCVPIVIAKGGQKEIVENTISGFIWDSLKELEQFTIKLIKDDKLREVVSKKAIERAKYFDKSIFEDKIKRVVNSP